VRVDRRALVVEAAWLLAVMAIAGVITVGRMHDPARLASGDTYWYARQAQIFAGLDPATASTRAADLVCQDSNRSNVANGGKPSCFTYVTTGITPRYQSIFTYRPGYPLFATPFVALLELPHAMKAATLALAMLAAAMAYLAIWMALGRRPAAVLGVTVLFLLPAGFWMSRLLTEGGCVAGVCATLIGAMLVLRGRLTAGLAVMTVALAWLFAFRSATGLAMVLVVVAGAVAALLFRAPQRRELLRLGGYGLGVGVVWTVFGAIVGEPGLTDTIQDYATTHFRRPDVPDPIGWLVDRNIWYWPQQFEKLATNPWSVAFLLFAAIVLLRRIGPAAWLWIGTGLIGVAMQIAHPYPTEYDRMMLMSWIPVACALGYAGALALARSRPSPAAPPDIERAAVPELPAREAQRTTG
jgi:hypothetical protein